MNDTITISRISVGLRVFGVVFALLSVGMIAAPALEDPRFVQADPDKYARMALFGKVVLPLAIVAIAIRLQWVLSAGGLSRRLGLFVPFFRKNVSLPTDPRIGCERHVGRGTSRAVYVTHAVLIEGPDSGRSVVLKRFGRGKKAEAEAFADAVSELMGIPRRG